MTEETTKSKSSENVDEIIKELCVSNGIQYSQLENNGTSVKKLEMFFGGFPKIVGLKYFPHLTHLIIVGQDVHKLADLQQCAELKELWVAECKLKAIDGLSKNRRLTKLYLYDNQIEKIENISHLSNLDTLWLSKNKIKKIEGLESLRWLRELNLSGNLIKQIGSSLDGLIYLHVLNLSGNKLRSFKDLTNLTKLPKLVDFSLKDPLYTSNPICMLCNYATHILYHLPKLERLDTLDVSSPQMKELADMTVLKKKMYYNMRVKVARRNMISLQNRLNKERRMLLQVPEERLRTINFALKSINQQKHMYKDKGDDDDDNENSEKSDDNDESSSTPSQHSNDDSKVTDETKDSEKNSNFQVEQIQSKIEALKQRIVLWKKKIEEVEAFHKIECAKVQEISNTCISRLILELETGGNVRFEQGSPQDVWFSTCNDLLLSRFCSWDYKAYEISGIKTHSITRVHNRILRAKFDEKVHALACDESGLNINNKDTGGDDDVTRVLEEGFHSADEYDGLGRDAAVPFSNSLFISENPRIQHCLQMNKKTPLSDPCSFRHGQVIIAKVFLGKTAPCQDTGKISCKKYDKINSVYKQKKDGLSTASPRGKEVCECSSRQCEWFIFDHNLALPEYIIDFEYYTKKKSPSPFLPNINISNSEWMLKPSRQDVFQPYEDECELDTEVLSMPPQIRQRPRIISLSEELLLKMGKAVSVSQITVLNLHGNGLSRLKGINTLSKLKHLVVSFNELTRLDGIAHMVHLTEVDASFNKINSLEGMRGMVKLKTLNLSWNQLTSLRDDLTVLRKHCPILSKLDIRSNTWIKADNMFLRVIGRLRSLTTLNNNAVTESDAASALHLASGSRISQQTLMIHSRTKADLTRCLDLRDMAEVISLNTTARPDPKDSSWITSVYSINLNDLYIGKLAGIDRLENLKYATLNHNCLTKLEGVERCVKLEEISVENNCIYKLDGLSKLVNLTKLNLSSNYLTSLDNCGFEKLVCLQHLEIGNNRLTSFKGLNNMVSLSELYAGNNRISNIREVFHLKTIQNLVILDLNGNPIVQSDNYRFFVIYHLQHLKAFDGIAIGANEENTAKDTFGGRLTTDFVAEQLAHSDFHEVRELDFPHSSVRTVDLGTGDFFKNLRSVNLEHNNLTSFSGLVNLQNVRVLCLNHNHIECIVPRPKNYRQQIKSQYSVSHQVATELLSSETLAPLMENLEVLHLGYNKIANMAVLQLSRLVNLKALFLQGNEISKIEGLDGLHELRELVLDRNKIKNASDDSFVNQWNLQELHLEENRIRDLSNLHHLENLQRLYLGMNRIQDMLELEKIELLSNLTELSLIGNAVSRRLLHRPLLIFQQPNLQTIDGIPISPEERTKAELYFMDQQSNTESILPGIMPHNRAGPIKVTHMPVGHERTTVPFSNYYNELDRNRGAYTFKNRKNTGNNALPQSSIHSQIAGLKQTQNQSLLYSPNRVYHPPSNNSRGNYPVPK